MATKIGRNLTNYSITYGGIQPTPQRFPSTLAGGSLQPQTVDLAEHIGEVWLPEKYREAFQNSQGIKEAKNSYNIIPSLQNLPKAGGSILDYTPTVILSISKNNFINSVIAILNKTGIFHIQLGRKMLFRDFFDNKMLEKFQAITKASIDEFMREFRYL